MSTEPQRAASGPRESAGRIRVRRWYVASLADADTHLAEPVPGEAGLVIASCQRRRFRPLAPLLGAPNDAARECPACDEQQQLGDGRVPPETLISPKEPEGKHSAQDEDDQ